jgi:hypothetical protein
LAIVIEPNDAREHQVNLFVEVGDLLFSLGEPSDPALLPRYQLYTRVKAALALPPGFERVAALHAAKIGDRKKH